MTILLCKSNQSTFLVEDIEDQARIPPLKKAIAPNEPIKNRDPVAQYQSWQ